MRNGLLLRVAFCVLVPGFPASGGEAYPDAGGSADTADTDYTFMGVSALREPLSRDDEWQTYRYVPPKPDRFGFSLDGVTLGEKQRTMLVEALSAVAANFPPRSQADVTVKQMALALAMRLSPTDKAPKMIDYLLRRGRQPTQVDGHERRDFVAAKLWNAGFGLGKYAETADDGSLSTLVLDVARRFDVEGTKSAATYDALRLPAASSRWNGVTDVPDVRVEEKPATPEPAIVEPAPFRFQRESASVPLFAAMQPLPQLVIEVGD